MFRNRQKRFPKEFAESVKLAKKLNKKTDSPSHYFAKIWSKKNVWNSVHIIRKIIARAMSELANKRERAKQNAARDSELLHHNESGREKFERLKSQAFDKPRNKP